MNSSRTSRRDFGSVRRLASGRWQARYPGAAGRLLAAPQTFATKAEPTGYLAALRTDQGRGVWVDPGVGQVPFGEYATTWMRLREIRPRTRELYTSLLANHLRPTFGDVPLVKITPSRCAPGELSDLVRASATPPSPRRIDCSRRSLRRRCRTS